MIGPSFAWIPNWSSKCWVKVYLSKGRMYIRRRHLDVTCMLNSSAIYVLGSCYCLFLCTYHRSRCSLFLAYVDIFNCECSRECSNHKFYSIHSLKRSKKKSHSNKPTRVIPCAKVPNNTLAALPLWTAMDKLCIRKICFVLFNLGFWS